MTSAIDICNQAFDTIGAKATMTSFEEPSKEAQVAKRNYDSTRRRLLRVAHWNFARKQQALTLMGTYAAGTSQQPWPYKYAYPADCLLMRYVIAAPLAPGLFNGMNPVQGNRFILGTDENLTRLFTNVENAIGVYTADIENPELWDPLFEDAMTNSLAAVFSMAITGDAQLKSSYEQLAEIALVTARAAAANEARTQTETTPDWIRARGVNYEFGEGAYYLPPESNGSW